VRVIPGLPLCCPWGTSAGPEGAPEAGREEPDELLLLRDDAIEDACPWRRAFLPTRNRLLLLQPTQRKADEPGQTAGRFILTDALRA
jgi:hypothetical protein